MGGTSGVYPVPMRSRPAAIDAAAVVSATMAALFDWNSLTLRITVLK